MVGKVEWHTHALITALQDPHKNVLVVFGHHRAATVAFHRAIDELAKNLPHYPCQINHQNQTITMAEGGRIHFKCLERDEDCDRIRAYEFGSAIYDDSWELVKRPGTRQFIRAMVASRLRQ